MDGNELVTFFDSNLVTFIYKTYILLFYKFYKYNIFLYMYRYHNTKNLLFMDIILFIIIHTYIFTIFIIIWHIKNIWYNSIFIFYNYLYINKMHIYIYIVSLILNYILIWFKLYYLSLLLMKMKICLFLHN